MASDNSVFWGTLVRSMTRKIEVPGAAPPAPPLSREDYRPERPPARPAPAGRRVSDPPVEDTMRTGPTPVATTREGATDRIAAHLGYVSRQQVDQYLDRHGGEDGPVLRRLRALGAFDGVPGGQAPLWWRAIEAGRLPPELLAEVLRSCPGMPQHSERGSLFDYVLDAELASYKDVKAAEKTAFEQGRHLLDVLAEAGLVQEARAADLVAEFFSLRRKRGRKFSPDAALAATVQPDLARAFDVVPLREEGAGGPGILLASAWNPGPVVVETLGQMTGRPVTVVIDTPSALREAESEWESNVAEVARKAVAAAPAARERKARSAPAKRPEGFRIDHDSFQGITTAPEMARALMERAIAVGATDIHLEPQRGGTRARFRLDGILYDVAKLAPLMGEEVLSRLKVMSDLDITERRKPQDGHIRLDIADDTYDFRLATVPTSQGERMSIRITAGSREVPHLELLELDDEDAVKLRDFTKRSHGIVLACGPVGSGKTTTLYACLGEVDARAKNIMTIEDPVEIELPDVSQVNVNYKLGMDFGKGLRALLRQDPNIILVGEVRDEETAKVAVRASLTGLLVLSTIHANSAPGAVTTLYNFNIPPFLLATSLVGVVAQRLLRTNCERCREAYQPEPGVLRQCGFVSEPEAAPAVDAADPKPKRSPRKKAEAPTGPSFFRGRGCDACYGTGYSGRRAIFEILEVDEAMRRAIAERAPETELRDMALRNGMRALAEAGRARVIRGETTVEEFARVMYQ